MQPGAGPRESSIRLSDGRTMAYAEYQQVTQLRTRALTEAVLQATTAW